MPKMKDDKITIITNDIERIRKRPSMIIGFLGEKGILHLCKEIIDNNRDECMKPDSPGDTIEIEIYKDHIVSRDNGRGLPTNLLRTIHETSQAGSNMTRSHGTTAGENGIGTTAFTALAAVLIVTTYRPQEKKKLTIEYHEGELVSEKLEDYTGSHHGLETYFKPSKKILGESDIPIDQLIAWIQDFEYTLPKKTTMSYILNGEKHVLKHVALSEYFTYNIPINMFMSDPITIECSGALQEVVQEKTYDRHFKVEASVMYASPEYHAEDIRKSWMNMIYTSQNGSHMNGVVNGLTKYLTERVKAKKKSLESDDLKRDILSHLNVVVKAECDFANMFSSQEKSTVFPRQLTVAITDAIYKELCNMSQAKLNDLVEIVIQNNRVRKEGERVRNISAETKKKSWNKPDSYLPCASIKTVEPKELYLVEGNSAAGGINAARNAKFQAILMFRGKSLNAWDLSLDQTLKSNVWFDLVKVLGCGIGPTFDIKKLNFDKIIISTDADVDGYHIRVGMCSFFLRFMPELLEAGKVYIAEPPLYKLVSGKQISYVASHKEYIKACIHSVGNVTLKFEKENVKADVFIEQAFDYLSSLYGVSLDRSVNMYLLEHIAHGMMIAGSADAFIDDIDEWLRSLTKTYPELGFDHKSHQIYATIDLHDQVVVVDEELYNDLIYVINIQKAFGMIVTYDGRTTTIARFFEDIQKKYPVIKERYKGLGSSDAKVSKEIIMDPRTRRIFKIDASDVNIMRTYDMLVGKTDADIKARKEMLLNFEWTAADIDT